MYELIGGEMQERKEIIIKTYVTASEFLAFQAILDEMNVTQSAALRRLVQNLIKKHCAEKASRNLDE